MALSPRMELIRLHVIRVGIELRIKLLREAILKSKTGSTPLSGTR